MKRFFSVLFLISFVVVGISAQQVSAYTTLEEPLAKLLFDAYEKQTGVKVNWVRLSGGEAVSRLEAEKANPKASIWVGGVGLDHITAKSKGLTEIYKSRNSKNTPKMYQDPQGYWIGLYVGPLTIVTNVDQAKKLGLKIPESWADLTKPEYKGLIRVANPNTSGTAYNLITTMRYVYNKDENKAFEYLKKLDANIDQYTRSGSAPGKSVGIGEIPIAIGYAHDQVKLKAGGANIVIKAPKEGTGFELASMSIVKGGPEAVEGKKLYDWILTKPAQDIIAEYFVVPVSSIATPHKDALNINDIKTVSQDFAWDGDKNNKERLLERWNNEIGSKR